MLLSFFVDFVPVVPEKIFKFRQCISAISLFLLFEKDAVLYLKEKKPPLTQGCFVPNLFSNWPCGSAWEEHFKFFVMYFRYFVIISP